MIGKITLVVYSNTFHAICTFLYHLKTSEDTERDQWHEITLFMYNVEKWPNILKKFCGVNIFRDVWPYFNIMNETVW